MGEPEAEVTDTIAAPAAGRAATTAQVEAPTQRLPSGTRAVDRENLRVLRSAGFAFLALVCSGAVLALAGKLQYAQLGAGSDPVAGLTGIVIAGLAVLGTSIHIGELTVAATPLGALALVGLAGAWATARMVREDAGEDLSGSGHRTEVRTAMLRGLVVAVPFALMCWLAALVFRIRSDPTPIAADGLSVLILALLWGAVFGIAGGLWAFGPRAALARWSGSLGESGRWLNDGARDAIVILAAIGAASLAALLLWIIGALLRGGPEAGFGLSGFLAAVIYVVAFAPNLLVSVITLSLGAPVQIGAGITQRGRLIGGLEDHSLFAWGGGGAVPWWVYLLPLIPAAATAAAGFYSARRGSTRAFPYKQVLVCGAIVGVVLFEAAGLSDARLGAGLVRNRGIALAAPEAWVVGLLAFVWTVGGVTAGWFVHERIHRAGGRTTR